MAYLGIFVVLASGDILSKTVHMEKAGDIRYHFDDHVALTPAKHILMIGVGTAMNVEHYDSLSLQIIKINPSIAVFLMDPNPGWPVKLSATDFARLVETTIKELPTLLPSYTDAQIIIGGHSAGGKSAIGALSNLSFTPAGYFGLDPFPVGNSTKNAIHVPVILWGFSQTTCGVLTSFAAKATYGIGNTSHRVLYQIQNTAPPALTHCSFTDKGCFGFLCPCSKNDGIIRDLVGKSVNLFVTALLEGTFEKEKLELEASSISVKMFVNADNM